MAHRPVSPHHELRRRSFLDEEIGLEHHAAGLGLSRGCALGASPLAPHLESTVGRSDPDGR